MRRLAGDQRGSVLALSAVAIPIFLVFVALVVDVGMWHTHKRQLQNRADAGALAAGVEYQALWASCGDPVTKPTAEGLIDAAAKRYSGDPQQSGTLRNTELTDQLRINVEINSASGYVDPNTSWNDAGVGGLGPCDKHPTADAFSPANSYYVDVGVRERDQTSLFGVFGLDLFRNTAHARVELKTIAAGKGFLPIALPDQIIEQAQLRYYRECGPGAPVLLAKVPLNTLASGYQTVAGTTLWSKTFGDLPAGTPVGITLPMPASTACGAANYIPVSAEVRVAGVASTVLDIDAMTCAQLVAARYADCWSRASNIRDFRDDPRTEPWFQEVTLSGGTCAPDALFARTTGASCTHQVAVSVQWNGVGTGKKGRDFTVSVGGDNLTPPNGPGGSPNGVWTSSGLSTNSVLGRSDLMLTWSCNVSGGGPGGGPCGSGSLPIHSLYLGDDATGGTLQLVRTSATAQGSGAQPGPPMQWYRAGTTTEPITVFPTVGIESSLYIGQRKVLRLPHTSGPGGSTNSQSLDCEPATGGTGHDFQMFLTGCDPWYTFNEFTGPPWWFPGASPPPGSCPDKNGIIAQPNSSGQAWQCVVKAPGFSPNVIADGIASAIGNCSDIQPNSCQRYACTNPSYYDPANPKRWALNGGEPSPRVVFLFVVPYGAYKFTGPQDGLPILNFTAFYITAWSGNGTAGTNPCEGTDPDGPGGPAVPDETSGGGDVAGYFVDYTAPDAPGDPDSVCVIGQLRPCVPVLVR